MHGVCLVVPPRRKLQLVSPRSPRLGDAIRLLLLAAALLVGTAFASGGAPIDRHALVTRHNPRITRLDPWAPLSVGNGHFAFTADVTGLQTFGDYYHKNGIPLETLARWAWHENANPNGYTLSDANQPFTAYGRTVGYPTGQSGPAGTWLRENPQDMPLAQLGLVLDRADGRAVIPGDLHDISQVLDLWSGVVVSTYVLEGEPVTVAVACHPARDLLAVRVESPLVAEARLAVRIALPRGHDLKTKNNPALDWSLPESHTTTLVGQGKNFLRLVHTRDASRYAVTLRSGPPLRIVRTGPHAFRVGADARDVLEFTVEFASVPETVLPGSLSFPDAAEVRAASTAPGRSG